MKENVFDVLMYLFEYYNEEDSDFEPDRYELESQLLDAGFPTAEVDKAFDWLDGLASQQEIELGSIGQASLRIYTEEECKRLDLKARGFLLFLEQIGILKPKTRELIIDRIMALDSEEFDLEQLKWVVLMVLFNQPDFNGPYHWLEEIVFDDSHTYLH
jgi:Smg protein